MKELGSFILIIKFALDIIRQNRMIAELQTKHKLNLLQALEKARVMSLQEHEDVKKKGPKPIVSDTNRMLDDILKK